MKTLMTPDYIVKECCHLFGFTMDDIKEQNRTQERVVCRAFISHFLRKNMGFSFKEVGRYIKRDHSAIVHLTQTVEVYRKMDILYSQHFAVLDEKFSGQKAANVCPTCGHVKTATS